jgi:hypothetical protein
MKLHPADLNMMTDFARQEIRDRIKSPHQTHDEFLAQCWVAALIRIVKKEEGSIIITIKNKLEELEV